MTKLPETIHDGKQPVPAYPYADAAEIALAPFGAGEPGVTASGDPLTIDRITAQNYRGTGLVAANEARILFCHSRNNWTGAKLTSSDSFITGCVLKNNRDVGLWIARDAGNCYSFANHCYGAQIPSYNEGGQWFRAFGDTYADGWIGHYSNAEEILTGCLFQHNTVADAVLYGPHAQLLGCTVMAQAATVENNEFTLSSLPWLKPMTGKIGVYMGGDGCSMIDGRLELSNWCHKLNTRSGKPATGIVVAADGCEISKTRIKDADQIEGTTGILVQGKRCGLVVDCWVDGFDDPTSTVLKLAPGASVTGLDVTLRVRSDRKPNDYVPRGDWSGVVRVINSGPGKSKEFKK